MTNPLDLPPVPSLWLTGYSDDDEFAIPPRPVTPGTAVSRALARLDAKAASRKAA